MEMFKVDDNDIQGRLEFNKEWWSAAQEGEPMAGDEIREVRWLIELAGKQHVENERLLKELEEAQKELNLTQSEVISVERLGLKYQNRIKELSTPRPLEEWHEDYGDVLWWELHVAEPPYCGNPLCSDWPGYHTHRTPIVTPNFGQEGEGDQDEQGASS